MKFTTRVPRPQAEAFNTAVYRYLELRSFSPLDETVVIESEPQGDHELKSVTLSTADAVREFETFWKAYSRPTPPYVLGR